jgi:hypothetical protein
MLSRLRIDEKSIVVRIGVYLRKILLLNIPFIYKADTVLTKKSYILVQKYTSVLIKSQENKATGNHLTLSAVSQFLFTPPGHVCFPAIL